MHMAARDAYDELAGGDCMLSEMILGISHERSSAMHAINR